MEIQSYFPDEHARTYSASVSGEQDYEEDLACDGLTDYQLRRSPEGVNWIASISGRN